MDSIKRDTGFAIALAWPETLCKQAGAWYDHLMSQLRINQKGYYQVGHAAMVLVNPEGVCNYFDFGRYHAPKGYGRVRSAVTDHDLVVKTKAEIYWKHRTILNIKDILAELAENNSTHGDGPIFGKETIVNYSQTFELINKMQYQEFIKYGPFTHKGTNCSRFVNKAIRTGCQNKIQKALLRLPLTITPTPMWNLHALGGPWHYIKLHSAKYDELQPTNNKLKIA